MAKSHFHQVKPSSLIIVITDLIAILATFLIGISVLKLFIPEATEFFEWYTLCAHLSVIIPCVHLCTLAVGLYNEKLRETFRGIAIRIFVAVILSYVLSTLVYKVIVLQKLPMQFNELFFLVMFLVMVLTRYFASKTPYKQVGLRRILVLGAGTRASIIERCMRRQTDRVGIRFVGFVKMKGDKEQALQRETVIELDEDLESYVARKDISEIVIAADERRNVLPNDELFKCKIQGIEVTDIVDFVERETGQVAVNHVYPSWMIYGNNVCSNSLQQTLDWMFNSIIALCIFAVTWPFMIITAICIKLEEGFKAPVLYSQIRTGLNGQDFAIYKFRSMRIDAEKYGAKWAEKEDPRITKVGNFIRKYRIDELPQLLNVLRGDMGFVGPRPERPQFIEQFEETIPYYTHRLNVKPGLTGWAQLKYPYGSSHDDAVEKLKFDLYYIKNRGFFFDLLILLRTAEIVLFGQGR